MHTSHGTRRKKQRTAKAKRCIERDLANTAIERNSFGVSTLAAVENRRA
jgi:hypothetical protein